MTDDGKLKIAFIGARGVGAAYSGIETYYEEVGSRLAARGHSVTAYCRSHFTPPIAEHKGIAVRRLPAIRSKHFETFSHTLLSTCDALARDFDIIQFHAIGSSPFALLPRLVGKTSIVSVRGLDWQRAKWGIVARTFLQACEWMSARIPTATAVVSEALRDRYATLHGREPRMIPNAVPAASHRPPDRIAQFGLTPRGYLLFSGRISPEKGVDTLLEALEPLKSRMPLVIAGGSSYSADYMAAVRRMAWDDVKFLGNVDRATIEELYAHCYAFVLPSHMEGLSVALLEALSHGACILASDIPENLEVVGSTALTFPPKDVAKLRECLRAVLDDPDLAERHRAMAAQLARSRPDWDAVAEMTESFYYDVLERRRAGARRRAAALRE